MAAATGIAGRAESGAAGAAPLSVVMPVHNAMPYLPTAIDSILSQTFGDFELFIGDDCSTDGGFECIRAYAARDSRIRYARSETRMGPVASSNWVANEARAPIVARMDADDISHPRRFELQMNALSAHPDAPMVGSLYDIIDGNGRQLRDSDRSVLLLGKLVPFAHPTMMYRNEVFKKVGCYREGTDYFEDTDLFVRFLKVGSILVIADNLLSVRLYGGSARLLDDQEVIARALVSASEQIVLDGRPANQAKKVTPGNFRAILEHNLWSGLPPGRLLPIIARMRMSPLAESIVTWLWMLLCCASPSLARWIGRLRVSWRNRKAGKTLRPGHVYRWAPGRKAVDLGTVHEAAPASGAPVQAAS
jgi:glycosyltransferase involved in cell wall biosynthesis